MKHFQKKFAAEFGVTFSTSNCWETGKATPSTLATQRIDCLLQQLGEQGKTLRSSVLSNEERWQMVVSEDDILIANELFERSPRQLDLEAKIQALRSLERQLTSPSHTESVS